MGKNGVLEHVHVMNHTLSLAVSRFTRNGTTTGHSRLSSDTQTNPRDSSLGCVVEQDGLDHAREDLGHVNVHNL